MASLLEFYFRGRSSGSGEQRERRRELLRPKRPGKLRERGRYRNRFLVGGATNTYATGINNLNQTTGFTITVDQIYGFRRDADGTVNWSIRLERFTSIYLHGDQRPGRDGGQVGELDGLPIHVILFRSPQQFPTFDYPHSTDYTVLNGINNQGMVRGDYNDRTGSGHAFIARVRLAEDE
jgi:hypothetical protein